LCGCPALRSSERQGKRRDRGGERREADASEVHLRTEHHVPVRQEGEHAEWEHAEQGSES